MQHTESLPKAVLTFLDAGPGSGQKLKLHQSSEPELDIIQFDREHRAYAELLIFLLMYARPVPLVTVREFLRCSDELPSATDALSELERISTLLSELPGLAQYCCVQLCIDGVVCTEQGWAQCVAAARKNSRGGSTAELQVVAEPPARFVYLLRPTQDTTQQRMFSHRLLIPHLAEVPIDFTQATLIQLLQDYGSLSCQELGTRLPSDPQMRTEHEYVWSVLHDFRQRCTDAGFSAVGQMITYQTNIQTHQSTFSIAPQFITAAQLRNIEYVQRQNSGAQETLAIST